MKDDKYIFLFIGQILIANTVHTCIVCCSSKGGPLVFDKSDGTTVQVGVVSYETGGENGKFRGNLVLYIALIMY